MPWTIASITAARRTLEGLLEELDLADYLFAIEPSELGWDVRVECRCREGSYVSRFHLETTALDRCERDHSLRREILRLLTGYLGDCTRAAQAAPPPRSADETAAEVADEEGEPSDLDVDPTVLGALSEYSATAGGGQPARPDLLSPAPAVEHPMAHFDTPDPDRHELHWYALEQATQDPHPRDSDLAAAEEAAMHVVRQQRSSWRRSRPRVSIEAPLSTIMTREVESVEPDVALRELAELFAQRDLHHVPVTQGEHVVGIVSFNDLCRIGGDAASSELRARDIMQTRPVTARADSRVREAAAVLAEGAFHALPVVDAEGRLAGIVTSTDLIRFLLQALH